MVIVTGQFELFRSDHFGPLLRDTSDLKSNTKVTQVSKVDWAAALCLSTFSQTRPVSLLNEYHLSGANSERTCCNYVKLRE